MGAGQGAYIPGKCNIGTTEIRRRYRIGFIGLLATILVVILFYIIEENRLWRLIIFFPVFYSFSGFIQALLKFCFFYGFKNVFSISGKRTFTKIINEEFVAKDKKQSMQIIAVITLCSIIITALYYSH